MLADVFGPAYIRQRARLQRPPEEAMLVAAAQTSAESSCVRSHHACRRAQAQGHVPIGHAAAYASACGACHVS